MRFRVTRHDLDRGIEVLRANPRLFVQQVSRRLSASRSGIAPVEPAESVGVSRTIDEVVDSLRGIAVQRHVVVYADAETRDLVAAALPPHAIVWTSHLVEDLSRGAVMPDHANLSTADAIVVAGPEAKLAYVNVLRRLVDALETPPVLWADAGWEFCGSQLTVPARVTDADIYLFHHFDAYFQVKDPLLVRVVASDEGSSHERSFVIQPRATARLTLDELLPERHGPAVVDVATIHPVLTRGRHQRWRLCADVHWADSLTTLHGAHDFGPSRRVESRRPIGDLRSGSVVVVSPSPRIDGTAETLVTVGATETTVVRDESTGASEITFDRTTAPGAIYGYAYTGAGTPFWYGFAESADRRALYANHELSMRVRDDPVALSSSGRNYAEALERDGFMLHPHALPVCASTSDLEFGFTFAAANPTPRRFKAAAFGPTGGAIARGGFAHDDPELPIFASTILSQLGAAEPCGLIVFGPDWAASGMDPTLMNFGGDLVVRNQRTGDFDVTEFQSCWRNLGMKVAKFPHWIQPNNAVTGRTHVMCRALCESTTRTGVVVAHAGGRLDYEADASVDVRYFRADGESLGATSTLHSFTSALWWLDEILPDIAAFSPEGYGTVIVSSLDADLNAQVVTSTSAGAVSLQHMWGY
jgi:hypothetical protein